MQSKLDQIKELKGPRLASGSLRVQFTAALRLAMRKRETDEHNESSIKYANSLQVSVSPEILSNDSSQYWL